MGKSPATGRWRRRIVHGPTWFLLWFVAWVGGVSAVAALWLAQGAVTLPDMARDAVAARLRQAVAAAGLKVELDTARVELREGYVPVVEIDGVRVFGAGGDVAVLDRIELVLDRTALLSFDIAPAAVLASGLQLSALRQADGRLQLRLGTGVAMAEGAGTGALLERLRAVLDRPPLQALEDIGIADLSLRFEDQGEGRVWETRDGAVSLIRRGLQLDLTASLGQISLPGAQAGPGQAEFGLSSAAPGLPAELTLALRGLVPADLAGLGGSSALTALLGRIAAPVTLELSAQLSQDSGLGEMDGRIAVGDGTLRLPGLAAPLALSHAGADLTLNPAHDVLRLRNLVVDAPVLQVKGEMDVMVERQAGQPAPVVAQMRFADLRLDRPDLLAVPLELEMASADARIDTETGLVRIEGLALQSRGLTVTGNGTVAADGSVRLDIASDRVESQRLNGLWPPKLAPGLRGWLTRNLRDGTLRNATLALRRKPATRPELGLSFEFEDGLLRPMRGLPLLREATGRASLDDRAFRLHLDSALMTDPLGGTILVRDALVVQPDTAVKGNTLQVSAQAEAATGGLLALMRLPVFRAPDAPPPTTPTVLPSKEVTGEAEVNLSLGIPLRPGLNMAAVSWAATGTLTGFSSDTLVGTRPLRAGPLSLQAGPEGFEVAGPVTLSDQPMTAAFDRPLNTPGAASTVTASGPLTAPLLASFGVSLPPGSVSGAGRFQAEVTLPPGAPPRIVASGTLDGMALSVRPVGWSKPAGAAGTAEIAGRLGPGGEIETLVLRAPGLQVDGRVALPAGPGGAPKLSIQRLAVGTWLDVSVELPGPGQVALTGGWLDLRARPRAQGDGGGILDLNLDRVEVSQGIVLERVQGRLTGGDGTLTASVGGLAPVRIVLKDGAIGVTGADAGLILRGAGLSQQVRGGALDLRLVPASDGFRGQVRVTDTALTNTPVVAELASGISGVGAIEQIEGNGIQFTDVRGDFTLTARRLTLSSGSAVGPSLGLSLEGVVALDTGALNLEGVLSPVYFLNRAGSFLTRRGEGLVGISFTLRGTQTAPRLEMNPLSVLTPGFLREIFRTRPGNSAN
jgi:hypothetical protein